MSWHCKATGGYDRTSQEGLDNAEMIAAFLYSEGFCIDAICALLGNGAGESGLNPWRWESDYVPTYNEFANWTYQQSLSHGYGLFGYTPASTYINSTNQQQLAQYGYGPNFSDSAGSQNDGEAQTKYFATTVSSNWTHNLYNYYYDDFAAIGVDISDFYNITFAQFKSGEYSAGNPIPLEYLTGAFELCYEKPADWAAASSYSYRVSNAAYWYEYFEGHPPTPVIKDDDFNIMLYLKPFWKK